MKLLVLTCLLATSVFAQELEPGQQRIYPTGSEMEQKCVKAAYDWTIERADSGGAMAVEVHRLLLEAHYDEQSKKCYGEFVAAQWTIGAQAKGAMQSIFVLDVWGSPEPVAACIYLMPYQTVPPMPPTPKSAKSHVPWPCYITTQTATQTSPPEWRSATSLAEWRYLFYQAFPEFGPKRPPQNSEQKNEGAPTPAPQRR